jgi:hypothetical protein
VGGTVTTSRYIHRLASGTRTHSLAGQSACRAGSPEGVACLRTGVLVQLGGVVPVVPGSEMGMGMGHVGKPLRLRAGAWRARAVVEVGKGSTGGTALGQQPPAHQLNCDCSCTCWYSGTSPHTPPPPPSCAPHTRARTHAHTRIECGWTPTLQAHSTTAPMGCDCFRSVCLPH